MDSEFFLLIKLCTTLHCYRCLHVHVKKLKINYFLKIKLTAYILPKTYLNSHTKPMIQSPFLIAFKGIYGLEII